jgi:Methyltransferase domain
LELGCNTGNNLLPLMSKYETFGVDIGHMQIRWLIKEAEKKEGSYPFHAALWDFAENGDLPPEWGDMRGKFKAINAIHVMSHFPDKVFIKTMQKMQDYLAPGGIIVLTIIDPKGQSRILSYSKLYSESSRRTLVGLNTHSQAVLEQAFMGMKNIESRPFMFGELKRWRLPARALRWVVYQKLIENSATNGECQKPWGRFWSKLLHRAVGM